MPPYKAKAGIDLKDFEADGNGTTASPHVPHRRNPDVVARVEAVEARVSNIENDVDALRIGQDALIVGQGQANALLAQILTALGGTPPVSSATLTVPSIPSLTQGGSVVFTQTINRTNFTGQVQIAINPSTLPTGVTVDPIAPTTGNSVQVTLRAISGATVGNASLQITATATGITIGSVNSTLTVVAAGTPNVTFTVPGGVPTLNGGQSVDFTIILSRTNNTNPVQIAVYGLPSGVTADSTAPTAGNSQVITLRADSSVISGTYTFNVADTTSGQIVNAIQVSLTLVAAPVTPAISFSVPNGPPTLNARQSVTFTPVLTRTNSNASVQFSVSGLPGGVTVDPAIPATTGAAPTITLNADSSVISQTVNFTLSAVSASGPTVTPASVQVPLTTVAAQVFDTILTGPSQNAGGVNFTNPNQTDTFRFDTLTTGPTLPASMLIRIGGVERALIDFTSRYLDAPWVYTYSGITVTGNFTNGTVDP